MRWLLIVGIIVLLLLQYSLWFSPNGILSSYRLKHKMHDLKQQNSAITKKNNQLKQDIEQLKHDPAAVAKKARDNFGMIQKNETYYDIVGDKKHA